MTKYIVLATIAFFVVIVGSLWIGANNREVRLRAQFEARQEANRATYDNMWKTISQAAQVADKHRQALLDLVVGNAKARSVEGPDKAVVNWVKEAVPTADFKTLENLQNIIVSTRASFTSNQEALLDIKREHDLVLNTFPASIFVGGRTPLKVQIVTSARTEGAFAPGQDNDVKVFQ